MNSPRTHRFTQVDVFTRTPYKGNPVAVVFDADDLDPETMQAVAAWTNLSETTFVQKSKLPEADYRLRIFTPKGELPFAGHPTVGSAHAILESGLIAADKVQLKQECGAGMLNLLIDGLGLGREIFVTSPKYSVVEPSSQTIELLVGALNLPTPVQAVPLIVDVGPRWMVLQLPSANTVHALQPDLNVSAQFSRDPSITGVTVFGLTSDTEIPVYVRSFAPAEGIAEDPVCGSGNVCVAAYLIQQGIVETVGHNYVANQGLEVGRNGFVSVRIDPDDADIAIGGQSVTCIQGELNL